MNKITLSSDIKQIELEIIHHKNIAGQSIWEIGKRLNHVKENDLAHGEFENWLSSIDMSHDQARKMMKVAKELKSESTRVLGIEALYLVSTLPEEERTKEHTTEKGETKTPDEMTVKELQQLNKRVKLQLEIIEQKNDTINKQAEEVRKLRQQEPKVIEKKVTPHDYDYLKQNNKLLNDDLKDMRESAEYYEKQYKELLDNREAVNEKSDKYDQLTEAIAKAEGKLNSTQKSIASYNSTLKLLKEANEFLMHVSGLVYMDIKDVVNRDNFASQEFDSLIKRTQQFVDDLVGIKKQNVIEGVFVNE